TTSGKLTWTTAHGWGNNVAGGTVQAAVADSGKTAHASALCTVDAGPIITIADDKTQDLWASAGAASFQAQATSSYSDGSAHGVWSKSRVHTDRGTQAQPA